VNTAPQDAPHAEQKPMNDAIQTVIMEAVKRSGSATPQVEVDVKRAFERIRPVYREPVPYLPCPKCGEKNVGVRVRGTAPQDDARDAAEMLKMLEEIEADECFSCGSGRSSDMYDRVKAILAAKVKP